MRISDWSSDVCSSDLPPSASILWVAGWGSGQVPLQKIALSRFLEQTLSRCWNSTVRAPKLPRSEEGAKEGAKEGDRHVQPADRLSRFDQGARSRRAIALGGHALSRRLGAGAEPGSALAVREIGSAHI